MKKFKNLKLKNLFLSIYLMHSVLGLSALGKDVNVVDYSGRTPLIRAALDSLNVSAIQALIRAGANVNAFTEYDGTTALMEAVSYYFYSSDLDAVRVLLAAGANVNATKKDGTTALMVNGTNLSSHFFFSKTFFPSIS